MEWCQKCREGSRREVNGGRGKIRKNKVLSKITKLKLYSKREERRHRKKKKIINE